MRLARRAMSLASRRRTSPGFAAPRILTVRKAVSLRPGSGAISGSLWATTPASWAAASTSKTPGKRGWPGKWPRRNGSSPRTVYSPVPLLPGSKVSRRSRKRNSGPWGKWWRATTSGSGILSRFEWLDDFEVALDFGEEEIGSDAWIQNCVGKIIAHGRAVGELKLGSLQRKVI